MKRTCPRLSVNDIAACPCQLQAVPTCVLFSVWECLTHSALSCPAILGHRLRTLSEVYTHLTHFVLSCVDDSCHSFGVYFFVATKEKVNEKEKEKERKKETSAVSMSVARALRF